MNGYELRLALLQMSKDLLMEEYRTQKEVLQTNYFSSLEASKSSPEQTHNKPLIVPPFPAINTIIEQAEILNEFVVKK